MISSNLLPTFDALMAEYGDQKMKADKICHELKTLTDKFKECFVFPEESDHSDKELTDRLLRHYVSEELVSPPVKEGSENRFLFQHVMELLAVRKLQSERALTLVGMRNLIRKSDPQRLYDILTRGARLSLAPNPEHRMGNEEALRAIRQIKQRQDLSCSASADDQDHLPGILADTSSPWKAHYMIAPGLELVVSEDFQEPRKGSDERSLIDAFRSCLRERRRRRPES